MNYYLNKAVNRYKTCQSNRFKVLTNFNLLKAIYCIELSHRNALWRSAEYIYWCVSPRKKSKMKILTIGRYQVKTKFLEGFSKIESIKLSNSIFFIDALFYNLFPAVNWDDLSEDDLSKIVGFYNGDKTGMYVNAIKYMMEIK